MRLVIEEREEEGSFVSNYTVKGPRRPAFKPRRVTHDESKSGG